VFFQREPTDSPNHSYPDYRDFRDQNTTFSGVAAYRIAIGGLSRDKIASPIWLDEASWNYFDVAEVQPFWGGSSTAQMNMARARHLIRC
jgi:hypothetical protein